jgi:hypothetical protein
MSREQLDLSPVYASMSTWPFYDTYGWISPLGDYGVPPKASDFDAISDERVESEEDDATTFDTPRLS